MFWSLPSVTSRPSAFGLNFGSCFHCPHLLIPSLGFYFLIPLFLLRAEKPSCSVMKCYRGNVLNLLHPSFLRYCKHEQIPRASENNPIWPFSVSSCVWIQGQRQHWLRYLQLLCMPKRQQDWCEHRTWPRRARNISAHLSCSCTCWMVAMLSLDPKQPYGGHSPLRKVLHSVLHIFS